MTADVGMGFGREILAGDVGLADLVRAPREPNAEYASGDIEDSMPLHTVASKIP